MTGQLEQFEDRLYAPLGRFIVEFEGFCQTIRLSCIRVFEHAGLRNRELAEITFASLTATPLFELYVSLTAEAYDLNEGQQEQLRKIRSVMHELVAVRNKAIHGTWTLIDFADTENGTPDAILSSSRRKPHGLERVVSSLSHEQLRKHTLQLKELNAAISTFGHSLKSDA